jgi:hypothetical protein
MTIKCKCFEKCGEICQRRVGTSFLTILGIVSVAAILFVLA